MEGQDVRSWTRIGGQSMLPKGNQADASSEPRVDSLDDVRLLSCPPLAHILICERRGEFATRTQFSQDWWA